MNYLKETCFTNNSKKKGTEKDRKRYKKTNGLQILQKSPVVINSHSSSFQI